MRSKICTIGAAPASFAVPAAPKARASTTRTVHRTRRLVFADRLMRFPKSESTWTHAMGGGPRGLVGRSGFQSSNPGAVMLDLNDVALFVQVVRAGSFAAAARRLNMPANTASRRIQQLEQLLGLRLMQRSTRKLTLTDAGATFYARCA